MSSIKISMKKHIGIIIFLLLSLLLIPTSLLGVSAFGEIKGEPEKKAGFELTVKDGLISLNAKDASLKEIIGVIGTRMKIDVIGNIPNEEKISAKFERLSLKNALEKLSPSYGYVTDAEKEEDNIANIIVIPKGEKSSMQKKESTIPVKHEPFKFEFDPTEYMEADE